MKANYKLTLVSALALILIIFSSSPYTFADGNVTSVQFGFNAQQNSTTATCTLAAHVTAGDSLMVTLDAAFIDQTTLSIGDSLGNSFVGFAIALNSASTWAKSFEAQNIAHGGSSDVITINYTDITGRGTYGITCAEFLGNVNFTQYRGIGTLFGTNCNSCPLTMVSAGIHTINYVSGWSESSQNPPLGGEVFTGFGAPQPTPETGFGQNQAISGSSNTILIFHGESDTGLIIGNNGTGVVVSCSPACNQSPAFVLTYGSSCISGACATVTSTITGFLVPNFVNGVSSLSWLYFLLVVLVPMAEIIGVITMDRQAILDRHAIIFIFLALLLLDSIFGVMLNVVTVAMPFIFGTLFGIYLWRGRG